MGDGSRSRLMKMRPDRADEGFFAVIAIAAIISLSFLGRCNGDGSFKCK